MVCQAGLQAMMDAGGASPGRAIQVDAQWEGAAFCGLCRVSALGFP